MEVLQNFKILFLDVWNKGISGVNISEIIIALIIFLFFLFLRGIFSKFVIKRLENYVSKTSNNFDNTLVKSMEGPAKFFPIVLGFFVATSYLTIETQAADFLETINRSLITILIFWTFHQIIGPFSTVVKSVSDLLSRDLVNWIIKALKVLIIILGLAAVLELWGIKIGPIIAGLGLFGVAVALGAQDLFKNLISGILVLVEKRFKVGDWIYVEDVIEGTVESIGFRSTVVRRFDKSLATIPNFQFAEKAVVNNSLTTNRRINWVIGLEYRTTSQQLIKIKDEIEKINNSLTSQAEPDYVDEILNFADEKEISDGSKKVSDKDELYQTAVEIIKSEGKASTSFLQRKLQIGYNRAARIIDMMEEEGIVSKANHVGKRDVL